MTEYETNGILGPVDRMQSTLPLTGEKVFEAVSDLIEQNRDALIGTSMAQGIGWESAEDAVQDVHLKLWEKRESIDPKSLKGLVYTSARNKGHDYRRYESRRPGDAYSDQYEAVAASGTVEDEVLLSLKFEAMMQNMQQLEPYEAKLLTLVYIEGYTYSEAADYFAIPTGTVKSRVNRAKMKLRMLEGIE